MTEHLPTPNHGEESNPKQPLSLEDQIIRPQDLSPTARKRLASSFSATCQLCGIEFPCFEYVYKKGAANFCSIKCCRITTRKPRELRPDAVQLSDGQWTRVSAEDLEWARSLALSASPGGYALNYHTGFHRMVYQRMTGLEIRRGYYVDHINRDPLDNRRENLRVAAPRHNAANGRLRSRNTSGFVGVSKNHDRYMATIDATRRIYIGTYSTAEEAAWMRDQWAMPLHGEFARLNFEYAEVA